MVSGCGNCTVTPFRIDRQSTTAPTAGTAIKAAVVRSAWEKASTHSLSVAALHIIAAPDRIGRNALAPCTAFDIISVVALSAASERSACCREGIAG